MSANDEIPADDFTTNLELRLESKVTVLKEYEQVIRDIILEVSDIRSINYGERNGVKWRKTFNAGKQQPVPIVEFTFPGDIKFELVFRPNFGGFEKKLQTYPLLQSHFPHVYLSQPIPYYDQTLAPTVLVIDKINGYEEKMNGEKFTDHISRPENFEQLCVEIFQIVDEMFDEPLFITDTIPVKGHNVFFNIDTGKFQLFDIDTVKISGWSHERKFMEFINPDQPTNDMNHARFIARMIQMYSEKYPERNLSYTGDEINLGEYVKVINGSIEEDQHLIILNDPRYEDAYKSIDWRGTRSRTDLPPLKLITKLGRNIFSIRADILEASRRNEYDQINKILASSRGNIIEQTFVESKK